MGTGRRVNIQLTRLPLLDSAHKMCSASGDTFECQGDSSAGAESNSAKLPYRRGHTRHSTMCLYTLVHPGGTQLVAKHIRASRSVEQQQLIVVWVVYDY